MRNDCVKALKIIQATGHLWALLGPLTHLKVFPHSGYIPGQKYKKKQKKNTDSPPQPKSMCPPRPPPESSPTLGHTNIFLKRLTCKTKHIGETDIVFFQQY